MKVFPVNGSPTLFDVESRSVQCTRCTRTYGSNRKSPLRSGDKCPGCGGVLRKVLPHRVDVAESLPIGKCACWHGAKLATLVNGMPLSQRLALPFDEQEELRCKHLKVARNFALNRDLGAFEVERLKNGKEEAF